MLQKSFLVAAFLGALTLSPVALASGGSSMPASPKPMAHSMMNHCKTKHCKMMAAARHRAWIMKVQEALNRNGAHLKTDGLWGPKTMMAIRSFQKSHGLKVTGHLNKATLSKLGLASSWGKKKAWHKK